MKIVESLKGTPYEINSSNEEDLHQLISDQMYDLYSNGDITDSEYNFYSLFRLEFFDDELGDFSTDLNYWDGLKDSMMKTISRIKDYLKFEEDVSAENKSFYYERMASSYKSQENQGKAEEFFKKAIDINKKNIEAFYNYSKQENLTKF